MIEQLKKYNIEFLENVSLSSYCTMKAHAQAKLIVFPQSISQLRKVVILCKKHNKKYFVLGAGSNLVFFNSNFVFIKLKNFNKIKKEGNKLICQAGATLNEICHKARGFGLGGIEGLYFIPAQIGGACVMNARAYGCEMADLVQEVKCVSSSGNVVTFSKEQCDFDYKQSIFQNNKFIILEVTLKLKPKNAISVAKKMEKIKNQRLFSQPKGFSAGCVFKNPKNCSAGKIIMECGLCGKKCGRFFISEKHGNFILNKGGGKPKHLAKLIEKIRRKVYNKKGIILEREIIFVKDEINGRLSHTHKI